MLTWIMVHGLRLAAPRAMVNEERKRDFVHSIINLITGKPALSTDPAVLMEVATRTCATKPFVIKPCSPYGDPQPIAVVEAPSHLFVK
jgi:hypothetical protein